MALAIGVVCTVLIALVRRPPPLQAIESKRAADELKGPPIEPQLLQEMLAYYREYNPGFANQPKCEGIVRVFMKKAKTAGEPGTWKELLYAALSAKGGCDDPREVWARQQAGGGGGGGAEPEPELGPI